MKLVGHLIAAWVVVDALRHPEKDIRYVIRRLREARRRGELTFMWRPAS